MEPPTVAVVIPTFQRAAVLAQTLSAVLALDYPAGLLDVVVVDDGSTDATSELAMRFPRVRYLRQPNRGVAAARNAGARESSGEIVFFIDDDIVVAPDNIKRHLDVRKVHPESVVAGCAQFAPEVRAALETSPFGRFRLWAEDTFQLADVAASVSGGHASPLTVASGNMSITRRLFEQLGGFDERFPVGAEDQDLCWRARQAGAAIIRADRIMVIHNDQHADLLTFSAREERGALGLVYLACKHPDFPAPRALSSNGWLSREDSLRTIARKLLRSAASMPIVLAAAYRVIRLAELLRPTGGWPLNYLYRAYTGLHVFRGIRKGLRLTASGKWPAAHDAVRSRDAIPDTRYQA